MGGGWAVAQHQVVVAGERGEDLAEQRDRVRVGVAAGRERCFGGGGLTPGRDHVETGPHVPQPLRWGTGDDGGGGERGPVVVGVRVVVAEVAAEAALGVEVDDEGSPAGVGSDAAELGGEGGLGGAALAVGDGDQGACITEVAARLERVGT